MQHNAAFHLGLYYLIKYSFLGFPEYKELTGPLNRISFSPVRSVSRLASFEHVLTPSSLTFNNVIPYLTRQRGSIVCLYLIS